VNVFLPFEWLIQYVLPFVLIITPLVFFHELGHFSVARAFGVRIETFSIGFGPAIASWMDRKGTRWKISWIPLGGYVKFFGDLDAASTPDRDAAEKMTAAERAVAFPYKPLYQRALIVAAGPAANFVLAIVILTLFLAIFGAVTAPALVNNVVPGSPAAAAGFHRGDLVVDIDGRHISSSDDLMAIVSMRAGETLNVTVERAGRHVLLHATPKLTTIKDGLGETEEVGQLGIEAEPALVSRVVSGTPAAGAGFRKGDLVVDINGHHIGSFDDLLAIVSTRPGVPLSVTVEREGRDVLLHVTPKLASTKDVQGKTVKVGQLGIEAERPHINIAYSPWGAFQEACHITQVIVQSTLDLRTRLFTSSAAVGQLHGPLGIAKISAQVAQISYLSLAKLAAFISISIGLVNLFPIPLLDGGHLLYYGVEAVLGRPLGARAQDVGFRLGLAVMLGLMLLATWNDLVRLKLF